MAYNLRNINVLDTKPSTGVGVALPFDAPGVFKTVFTTAEQLRYNIINFLLTNRRERIFNASFGANIRSKLFEQISESTVDDLKTQIQTGVQTYFPNIIITSLNIGANPDTNELIVQFSYVINNTGESDNIILSLNGQ